MKRILIMALVAAFVLSAASFASASEMKVSGKYDFAFQWLDNGDLDKDSDDDDFHARQRLRTKFSFVANENLKGVWQVEIGEQVWGAPGSVGRGTGASLGSDGVNVETKHAYIAFTYPGTALSFTIGLQGIALPNAVAGSPVLDDDMAAVVASYKVNDMVSVTGAWARLIDAQTDDGGSSEAHDEFDVLALIVPVSMDNISVTPWAAYGMVGSDLVGSKDDVTSYWIGAAVETTFDPIFVNFDVIYGATDADEKALDASGFFIDAVVGYKADFATLKLVGLYSTGADDDATDGSEIMPTLSPAWGFTIMGTDGAFGIIQDSIITGDGRGAMALGFVAENISFVEKMTHSVRLAYYRGTSDDKSGVTFTEEDSAWEVSVDAKYMVYENLATVIELGYLQADFDEDIHGDDFMSDPAIKLALGLQYAF